MNLTKRSPSSLLTALLLCSFALLAACGDGSPGPRDVRPLVWGAMEQKGVIAVKEYDIVNAYKDGERWVVKDKTVIEFLVDGDGFSKRMGSGGTFGQLSALPGMMGLQMQCGNFKPGSRCEIEGKHVLVKGSKGWAIPD